MLTFTEIVWLYLFAGLAGAYLIGSIPFGLVLTRAAGLGDIRAIGSGNIGVTNVLRTGNRALAALTLLMDSGKGALAIAVYALITTHTQPALLLLIGLAAMIGHCFPIWLKFKGGKGVATALGVLLAVAPFSAFMCVAVWILVAVTSRYSSLAAISAAALSPVATTYFYGAQEGYAALAIALLILSRHRANIKRLLRGQEPQIGQKT